VAIVLVFAVVFSLGSARPAGTEGPGIFGVAVSVSSASSNSGSCTIAITMTGMVGAPGDLSGR
jgi:hypothetical protein